MDRMEERHVMSFEDSLTNTRCYYRLRAVIHSINSPCNIYRSLIIITINRFIS